jgi:hypothetical protein
VELASDSSDDSNDDNNDDDEDNSLHQFLSTPTRIMDSSALSSALEAGTVTLYPAGGTDLESMIASLSSAAPVMQHQTSHNSQVRVFVCVCVCAGVS